MADKYQYTYLAENGFIYGVPLVDGETKCLKKNNSAVDLGGGVVGLPFKQNPFVAGMKIRVNNTTNYDGIYTLQSQTNISRLAITHAYVAETFGGDETVVRYVDGLPASAGAMIIDASGNIYYGHNWDATHNTYVTRIKPDGTMDWPLDNTTWLGWAARGSYTCQGLASRQDGFLITLITGTLCPEELQKWNLSTGAKVWGTDAPNNRGAGLAIDANGNVYTAAYVDNYNVSVLAAATGGETELSQWMGEEKQSWVTRNACENCLVVVDTLGIVIGGAQQYCPVANDESYLYNLAWRKLDDSTGGNTQLDGTYIDGAVDRTYSIGRKCIQFYNGSIYVLQKYYTGTPYKLYKLKADLTILASVAAPPHARAIYFDPWGNLVVVNQDGTVDDVFWYYDSDLNYLGKAAGFHFTMLDTYSGGMGFYPTAEVVTMQNVILGVPRQSYAVNAKHIARRHATV